jgi:hypothetical protein
MRRAALVALAALLAAGITAAHAAPPAKRAKPCAKPAAKRAAKKPARCAVVRRPRRPRRLAIRSRADRLVDALRPGAPLPQPGTPGSGDPGSPQPALPSFVSVSAREFSLTLSRPLVGAGNVRIELRNVGEDPHNLVVSPEGTHTPLSVFSELEPDTYERRTVALQPGRYQLWCSLEFHEGYGMSTTLRVE